MNNRFGISKICTAVLLMASGLIIFGQNASALPEDANQKASFEGGSLEYFPDQGEVILRENVEGLAHIKQGSMEIFASEIRLVLIDGVVSKATAVGMPARFQQQPALDQAIVYLSGHTLDYDNGSRMLNIDGEATYTQAGNTLNGLHIDYNLDTRKVNAKAREGESVQMLITPASTDQP
jgi:lipopolysaccharide export system protein LptA